MRITFVPVLLSLSACQGISIEPDETESAGIGPALKAECANVTDVPAQPTVRQMADLWYIDRANLGDCRRRHKALAEAAETVERQFESGK